LGQAGFRRCREASARARDKARATREHRPLRRAQIPTRQTKIGIHRPHQRQLRKMPTLGHDLRTDDQIHLPVLDRMRRIRRRLRRSIQQTMEFHFLHLRLSIDQTHHFHYQNQLFLQQKMLHHYLFRQRMESVL
jgi:hypothetical protein